MNAGLLSRPQWSLSVLFFSVFAGGTLLDPVTAMAARKPTWAKLNSGDQWTATPANCTECGSNPGDPATVCPGDTIEVKYKVKLTDGSQWTHTAWTIEGGSEACANTTDNVSEVTFNIVAPNTPGTYDLVLDADKNATCSEGSGGILTMLNALIVLSASDDECCEGGDCTVCGEAINACIYIMLDRTGSTDSSSRADEKEAAIDFIDFLGDLEDPPPVAIGTFGCNGSGFPANGSGHLGYCNGNADDACTLQSLSNTEDPPPYGDNATSTTDGDHYAHIITALATESSTGTHFACALDVVNTELGHGSCPAGMHKILIFISDGGDQDSLANTVNAANHLKNDHGVEIFAVLFPPEGGATEQDQDRMEAVASEPKNMHYFFAPDSVDLMDIFDALGSQISCDDDNVCTNDFCEGDMCEHDPVPNGTPCSDGLYCNGNESCWEGVCVDGNDPCANPAHCNETANTCDECDAPGDCSDGLTCTGDLCTGGECSNPLLPEKCLIDGVCYVSGQNNPNNACQKCAPSTNQFAWTNRPAGTACGNTADPECDNPDVCNGSGMCVPNYDPAGTPCGSNVDTICTNPDTCNGQGMCLPNHATNGTSCSDANHCTTNDACSMGNCVGGAPPTCVDANICTTDSCNPASGCVYAPNSVACNDGNVCTTGDHCVNLVCVGTPIADCEFCTTPGDCTDGLTCTSDLCVSNECSNPLLPDKCLIDGVCYNNNQQNPNNACQKCAPGTNPYVWTNRSAGTTCGSNNNTECDNPDTCDGNGMCVPNYEPPGHPCGSTTNTICTDPDTCDGQGGCIPNHANNGTLCTDNNACTTIDICTNGNCVAGPPLICSDGNICTNDICDPAVGCVYPPNTVPCNDGQACTTGDHCENAMCVGTPVPGCEECETPSECTDGIACTSDLCVDGQCSNPLQTDKCLIDDVCYNSGAPNPVNPCQNCVPGSNQYDWTNQSNGTACGSNSNTDCDNPDICVGGMCVPNNEPPGTPCGSGANTACDNPDTCNGAGMCVPNHEPNGTPCSDSNVCTTNDLCVEGSCEAGPPLNCDDGDPCTVDFCDPVEGCQQEGGAAGFGGLSITCPPDVVVRCESENGFPVGALLLIAVATPGATVFDDRPDDFYPPTCDGAMNVTFTATDSCGVQASCFTSVRVISGVCCPTVTDTDLKLLVTDLDLRQDTNGPVTTKARFDVWNMNEVRFSGTERCITCWDETLISQYGPIANHLLRETLQTDKGKARIHNEASTVCPLSSESPLLGVAIKELQFLGSPHVEMRSAVPLVGMGDQSALILYDIILPPDEESNLPDGGIGTVDVSDRSARATERQSGVTSGDFTITDLIPGDFGGSVFNDGEGDPTLGVAANRASTTYKGSLIIWPVIELKWNASGQLIQDTFVQLLNDNPSDVMVQFYQVNGDRPLDAVIDQNTGQLLERAHPGWNKSDYQITLTGDESAYWSAASGQPKGTSPFWVLDSGNPMGRPDLDPSNLGGRVLRGFLVGWAVNGAGREIRWNHLQGHAVVVRYNEATAFDYNPWSFRAVSGVGEGLETDGFAGRLSLDGIEYDNAPSALLFDFFAAGTQALSHPSVRP